MWHELQGLASNVWKTSSFSWQMAMNGEKTSSFSERVVMSVKMTSGFSLVMAMNGEKISSLAFRRSYFSLSLTIPVFGLLV